MNYILNTDWTPENHAEVQRALVAYRYKMRDARHPYSPIFDKHFDYAASSVASGAVEGVIIGGYLVLFTVATMWFSPQPVLIELMLTTLPGYGPQNFKDMRECLEQMAADRYCIAVAVGNAYLRPGLTRRYTSAGYDASNTELIKEIPNG